MTLPNGNMRHGMLMIGKKFPHLCGSLLVTNFHKKRQTSLDGEKDLTSGSSLTGSSLTGSVLLGGPYPLCGHLLFK